MWQQRGVQVYGGNLWPVEEFRSNLLTVGNYYKKITSYVLSPWSFVLVDILRLQHTQP